MIWLSNAILVQQRCPLSDAALVQQLFLSLLQHLLFPTALSSLHFCRKKHAYVDVPVEEGDETIDEGQCVEENKKMTVTVNPLEKFETEDHAGSRGSKNPKTLEWDDAYIA